jgi:Thiamine pyrophosphate enzyme, C-terminal TPP binding domain
MLMGEFRTAVHHELPVKVIVYNNSAFGLITLEAESVGLVPFREAIEFPNPDFAALARACGGHGYTARQPGDLKAAISEAFAVEGPAIIDAIVVPDEMPNMPHVEFEQLEHFAIAKIRRPCSPSPAGDRREIGKIGAHVPLDFPGGGEPRQFAVRVPPQGRPANLGPTFHCIS